jgi:polyvinyl alcohol dehydrogenase (cytochrome)
VARRAVPFLDLGVLMSARRLAAAMFVVAGSFSMMSFAQAPAAGAANGEEVFKRACAACHNDIPPPAVAPGPLGVPPSALMARAVPPERLKLFSPEAIYNALTNGKMQTQAASLTEPERRAAAEFASGQTFSGAKEALAKSFCTNPQPKQAITANPQWASWGNGIANARFQPKEQGKLTAQDLPRLKLKWAFGYANVASARAQPIVSGGRLFAANENRDVYSLDAKTGCTYWTFQAIGGVRSALSIGPYKSADGKTGTAVFFGDQRANAYAVDAQTGKQIWTTRLDTHPAAGVTGAPLVFEGRMHVPVQGIGEEGQGANNNYECCTFRGSVTTLDVNTGKVLWKTYTVGENKPRGKTKEGVQTYGPAGGGIWSSPTVDAKRKVLYVATGNGYADPPQPMTNAIIAMDLATGAVKWVNQVLPNDVWAMGCKEKNPDNPACPAVMGPDYDFSAPPALLHTKAGRDLLVLPQKSGMAHALDPDNGGKMVWQYQFGKGSGLGGQWGTASDGEIAYFGVADVLTPTPGGMHAVNVADGKPIWKVPPQKKLCGEGRGCSAGQGGALTAIPGGVLNGGLDGGLRAYAAKDGSVLWTFDTNKEFTTVNGVRARGGSMDGPGPVVVDGMLYVNSGYGGLIGNPGNVLLAFGLE